MLSRFAVNKQVEKLQGKAMPKVSRPCARTLCQLSNIVFWKIQKLGVRMQR